MNSGKLRQTEFDLAGFEQLEMFKCELGIRPRSARGTAGQVDAMTAHIDDLRKIADMLGGTMSREFVDLCKQTMAQHAEIMRHFALERAGE